MAILTAPEIAWLVKQAGGSSPTAVAVALAESGGNTAALHADIGSYDRGLWQINSAAHPEVTDACAFSPVCSTNSARSISNGWTDFSPWSSYKYGGYQIYMPQATAAMSSPQAPQGVSQAQTLAQPSAMVKHRSSRGAVTHKITGKDHTPKGGETLGQFVGGIGSFFSGIPGDIVHAFESELLAPVGGSSGLVEVMVRGGEIIAGTALFGVGMAMFVVMLARDTGAADMAEKVAQKGTEAAMLAA